jgi:cytidine deaminase
MVWFANSRETAYIQESIGPIAQLGERYNGIVEVVGSIPSGSTQQRSDIHQAFFFVQETAMTLADDVLLALVTAARTARESAYAPYSRFRVGAALLCSDGDIVPGCNVENSSYSLTCCAERSAVFSAVSKGHRSFTAIAIAADKRPVPPCGACRQVLAEFDPALPVILCDDEHAPRILSLADLLPEPFTPEHLDTSSTRK